MNEEKKCEISEKLIKFSSNNDNSNYKNTIKDLLFNGANINYQDKNGYTALMLSFGFPKKSKFLLEKGANPNIKAMKVILLYIILLVISHRLYQLNIYYHQMLI